MMVLRKMRRKKRPPYSVLLGGPCTQLTHWSFPKKWGHIANQPLGLGLSEACKRAWDGSEPGATLPLQPDAPLCRWHRSSLLSLFHLSDCH